MKNLLVIFCALFIAAFAGSASALVITPLNGDTPLDLAQDIVGAGIAISNVTYVGTAGGDTSASSGYFTGGAAAGIGIESGIVLTSGLVENLEGTTNTSDGITGELGLPGDSDLNGLIPGYSTYDASILEFDFVSSGDAAYFNYVFGSEEYDEYVNSSYNDVFGFFLDGVNVALIPGTTTAVSINNVNNGYYNDGVGASNPEYYNDNDIQTGGAPYPFEYDGFTDVFTAEMTGLTPGDTYHMKLAIADAGDRILDSGVFLQAGSFSDTPVDPIPEPGTLILLGTGLAGLAGYGLRRRKKA